MLKKILLLVGLATLLFSKEVDENLIAGLQNDLLKYSQIATETKQNVDYMPYVVSVLNNKELTKLGVLNLREALSLVPGVDISITMLGVENPIFRGSNPFAMGQSKLIIDGIVVNSQMFNAYNQYLDMPIDIIERIEVVRGPGSTLNNVNAYAGSIHVITKANNNNKAKKEKSIFASYGSDNYKMGGFVASYENSDFKISGDLFYQEHDKELPAGPDRLGNSSIAPLWLENYALGLNVSYKDLYLKSRFSGNKGGVSYGQSFILSDDSSDNLDIKNNFAELGYNFDIAKHIKAKLSVSYFDESRILQNKVKPDTNETSNDGIYFLADYAEQTYTQNLEIKISSFSNHLVTTGIAFSQSRVKNNSSKKSNDDMQSFFDVGELLLNNKRDHSSFYIDDLINLSEKISVQLGLKIDAHSDVKTQYSPRLAMVYRYDDENIYKIMYTNSFREPSWREQYLAGAPYHKPTANLESESVDAFEAAYIKKFAHNKDFKINIFYLFNKDQINAQNADKTFRNSGDGEIYGFESEFRTSLTDNDQLYLNYSFADGENTSGVMANSAQSMAKLYYIYNINSMFALSSIIKYISDKDRADGDDREKVDAYTTVDFTATYSYKPSNLTISLSVKNIFDEHPVLSSPVDTYPADFKQDGQSFLIRMSKRF